MSTFDAWDRQLGDRIRRLSGRVPFGLRAGRMASEGLAPAAHGLIATMLIRPAARRSGLEALVGAACAATVARAVRDRIARPRPGERSEGGMPSRHAAAAVAIARAVGRRHPRLGHVCTAAVAVGLAGRVVTAHHDPLDILSGAVVGWAVDTGVERLADGGA